MPDLKICTKCGEEKSLSEFINDRSQKCGKRPDCKVCSYKRLKKWWKKQSPLYPRKQILKRQYGLEWNEYTEMVNSQDSKCAICEIKFKLVGSRRKKDMAHVDHNHNTGQLRGILCHKCNAGLGLFNDDIFLLETAVKYLQFFNGDTNCQI